MCPSRKSSVCLSSQPAQLTALLSVWGSEQCCTSLLPGRVPQGRAVVSGSGGKASGGPPRLLHMAPIPASRFRGSVLTGPHLAWFRGQGSSSRSSAPPGSGAWLLGRGVLPCPGIAQSQLQRMVAAPLGMRMVFPNPCLALGGHSHRQVQDRLPHLPATSPPSSVGPL